MTARSPVVPGHTSSGRRSGTGVDRRLVDEIKKHFAGKSSAQLREIAGGGDRDRWSEEAFAAARETLLDRAEGRARAPQVPREDAPPPPPAGDVLGGFLSLAVRLATGVDVGGALLFGPDPDQPVPFGPGTAWLALDTTDTAGVAAALGLRGVREATWDEGVAAARRASVFVTPPLGDWTLAVSAALLPPPRAGEFLRPLLEGLSRRFSGAQYFCAHGGAGLRAWARASRGRLLRGYARLDREARTLWDEGVPTAAERDLGLLPPAAGEGPDAGGPPPGEAGVMHLAAEWSVDPTALDEHFKEPVAGLLGDPAPDGGGPPPVPPWRRPAG